MIAFRTTTPVRALSPRFAVYVNGFPVITRPTAAPTTASGIPLIHLRVPAGDRAPVLVIGHGHAAFNADPHALRWCRGVRRALVVRAARRCAADRDQP